MPDPNALNVNVFLLIPHMLGVSVLPAPVAETATQHPPSVRSVPCLYPLHFSSHAADSQK